MSDDGCERFLIKGSPFWFPSGTRLQAVADLDLAKPAECRIAEYMLSRVKAQKDLLLTRNEMLAKKFETVPNDLDKYEEGLIMPLQLVCGVSSSLIKDQSGICKQIDLISANQCQDFLQFYAASLPKCVAIICQDKNSWYKVLHHAHEYCSDLYYQVGVKVAQMTFLDIRSAIKTSQKSLKH